MLIVSVVEEKTWAFIQGRYFSEKLQEPEETNKYKGLVNIADSGYFALKQSLLKVFSDLLRLSLEYIIRIPLQY